MTVDPMADLSNPEVCDSCAGNCGLTYYESFASNKAYLGGGTSPVAGYAFFINSVVAPSEVRNCPASPAGCAYAPSGVPPAPPGPTPTPPKIPLWLIVLGLIFVAGVALYFIFR